MYMNLPTKLTVVRIILAIIIMVMLMFPFDAIGISIPIIRVGIDMNLLYVISGFIFVVASFTDFLDGFIARKYDMITELGKLVDPMADKLTQLVVACTLVVSYPSYIWLIVIILLKDGMLLLAGIYLLKKSGKHLEQAEMPGKVATCVFFVVSIILLAFNPGINISNIMIYTTVVLMVIAMVHYAKGLYNLAQ